MDLLLERSLNHWLCSINHNAQERIEKESSVNRVTVRWNTSHKTIHPW